MIPGTTASSDTAKVVACSSWVVLHPTSWVVYKLDLFVSTIKKKMGSFPTRALASSNSARFRVVLLDWLGSMTSDSIGVIFVAVGGPARTSALGMTEASSAQLEEQEVPGPWGRLY